MRIGVRWLVVFLQCSAGFCYWTVAARADNPPPAVEAGSPLSGALVLSGSPTSGEQTQALEQARLANPEAIGEREASRTEFAGLDKTQAATVAGEAFPAVVADPVGGPPRLPAGQRIAGFPASNLVSVDLGGGERGVIESLEPVVVKDSSGQRVPIDLSLTNAGSTFHPATPLVEVQIPKHLNEGVQLSGTGVSLTPVAAEGAALTGEGVIDGAVALYANTQTDADTVIKPVTTGFEADTILRSVESPEQLSFRVGLPAGASLVQASGGSGVVQVVDEGAVLAGIMPPSARDAAGTTVPVSMSVSGDTLTLTVSHHAGPFRYPIEVDPTVTDSHNVEESSRWGKEEHGAFQLGLYWEEGHSYELRDKLWSGAAAEQWGSMFYAAQGEAHIYELVAETYAAMPKFVENRIGIIGKGGWEPEVHKVASAYGRTVETFCAASGCASSGGTAENVAQYVQYAVESGSGEGYANLSSASVSLAQANGPTAELDTKDSTTYAGEGNVFNTNGWIGPQSHNAMQTLASDPGVGVYGWKFHSSTSPEWSGESEGCFSGAICKPSSKVAFDYGGLQAINEGGETWGIENWLNEKKLGDGPQTVELTAYDSMGLTSSTLVGHVKVDASPPHNVTLSGLPSTIGEQQYTLSTSAMDGSGSVESSGVASIKLAVDGRELGNTGGACSPGPCTGKGAWTLNGSEFSVGEHKLTLTATDSAGNVASEQFAFKVLPHAAPISIGPGAVDPLSGEFSLGATDISLGAPGADLTVTRSYRSRHLLAGSGGPLGPQWSLSVGGEESITKLEGGSVTLTAANGGQTTFTKGEGTSFSSPAGDKNLALSEVKNEKGELTEYLLKNAANNVSVRFTSTSGPTGSIWKATKQEGPVASQTVRYIYQTAEGVTEPVKAIAPEPAGVSCSTTLNVGCRALEFQYSSSTTAKGEGASNWGHYRGRLEKVWFIAYNPTTKAMASTAVAQYAYDGVGRLRAEWDPRISPALETTYGYDAEGHVTAVSRPGQEPWLLQYGTSATDNKSRLLSVARPSAATALGTGEPVQNMAAPTLSSTKPAVGTMLSVSGNGTWNNTPLSYSYQWQDCNASGGECTPILGAVNQSYSPATGDEGHTLVAKVIAVNADGSASAASAATGTVASGTPSNTAPPPPNPGTNALWTIHYGVALSGEAAPEQMTSSEVSKWGQADVPTQATAIFPPDEPMGWPAGDYKHASISYYDARNRDVNVATPAGGISTTEFNENNDVVRTLSADNRAAALKEGCKSETECKSAEVSRLLDTENTYNTTGSEPGTELLSSIGPQHTVKLASGTQVEARAHTVYGYNALAPKEGGPYHLPTSIAQGAQYSGKEEDVRTTTMSYSGQLSLGWKLRKPTLVTTDPSGLKLLHTTMYERETGNVTETRMPANPIAKSPHATETIYYTTGENSKAAACGLHPEWANLPCQTQPAAQPETAGLPKLPVTKVTYNIWDEPETVAETVESKTRTKTYTYDSAGRLKTSTISSPVGTALPGVTYEHNATTGALEKQSTTTERKTKTITAVYNRLGQLESYTDADGNTATYEYDVDGRIHKANDGKGTQTYTYNATTDLLGELVDSSHEGMRFTAGYDVEGNMLTEGYPNGMTASYAYNQLGTPVALEYNKTTHCSEKCTWFKDSVIPSIHGQLLEQASTFSHQAYVYDAAGRLTQVQNTPVGKGCTTRVYAYDEDTNRTSLTTREPNAKGECATEGGTVEKHTYDTADRLIDASVSYDAFGDITSLPAADAGGNEPPENLTSAYYVDDQLASQTQNGETIGYNLDPAGRTRETIATGKMASDVVNHYAGPSDAPAWTVNTSSEWTRNISNISGSLGAVQHNGEAPVLQLTNLHGDIIATASLSETATELASKADTSEYGVPAVSAPPKYSWLGAIELPTELPSGVIAMGARSYVPQLGRYLQPDPIAGGSANAYSYTFGDPVNSSDPSGADGAPAWLIEANNREAHELTEAATARRIEEEERKAAEEAAARAAAEAAARAAAAAASVSGPQYAAGEEEWEEWEEWEEEGGGGEEYVSYRHGGEGGKVEGHVEAAVLEEKGASFGPGVEGESRDGAHEDSGAGVVPLCELGTNVLKLPCARNASIFGKIWHWVKKHVKQLVAAGVGFVSSTVVLGVSLIATVGCIDGTDGFESFDCYKIGAAGVPFALGGYIASYRALTGH